MLYVIYFNCYFLHCLPFCLEIRDCTVYNFHDKIYIKLFPKAVAITYIKLFSYIIDHVIVIILSPPNMNGQYYLLTQLKRADASPNKVCSIKVSISIHSQVTQRQNKYDRITLYYYY